MGNRPIPKPAERRQRRNKPGAALVVSSSTRSRVPAPPAGLLKSTVARWLTYWNSELARAARESHIPTVERLFQRYDERERAYRTIKLPVEKGGGRVTIGSTGQLVAHPLLKYIDSCDAEIRQLEDRLGLSPRAMAALGASFASAQKSLDDLNSSMEDDEADDSDSDPRLSIAK